MDGLEELGISEIGNRLDAGELTVAALVDFYINRIEGLDRKGPKINSVIELNPETREIAERLDGELRAGKRRGPLHGIPLLLKDNIDTADRLQTTAGSLALAGHRARRDAALVERLRAAGALVLGKTNMSEWANFRGLRSTSGWSSRGGQTRNPHVLDRTPCGSSSGSGAAVAAGFCAAAVGTETDGSIVCPAQTNGIVGIKPTVGLVSRAGLIPISRSQDTAGPMARSVEDAAIMLGAMAGADPSDPATKGALGPSGKRGFSDYRPCLDPRGLEGARIGVARKLFGSDKRVLSIMESSLEAMREAGALILEVELAPSDPFARAEIEVFHYEFRQGLEDYLATCSDAAVGDIASLIDYNYEHRDEILPFFGQEHLEVALTKGPLTSRKYLSALERCRRLSRSEGLDAVIASRRLDCLVFPTGGPAWMIDPVNGDCGRAWDMDGGSHAAVAGYPHITVPAGFIHDLPVGLSFVGRAWKEPTLIKLAYAFERATRARKAPRFLRTAPVV